MRRFSAALAAVLVLLCTVLLCAAETVVEQLDFSCASILVLNGLKEDIAAEYRYHYDLDGETKEAVKQAALDAVNKHYRKRDMLVTWAWYDWEYEYTRDKDLFTLKTHLNYRDKPTYRANVLVKLYWNGTEYVVYEMYMDGDGTIRPEDRIPEGNLCDLSRVVVNRRTGINLSELKENELKALEEKVDREIAENHTPRGDSRINNALISLVENIFAERGVRVVWHWFDYTYTCDWNCYTETIRIDYEENGEKHEDVPVYAEVFPAGDGYQVYYLKIGDRVLTDALDQVDSREGLLFLHSRKYENAQQLVSEKKYEEAAALLEELGEFEDSKALLAFCRDLLDHPDYLNATELMEAGRFGEALAIFEAQGDYSDSRERADQCREEVYGERYVRALILQDEGKLQEALEIFLTLAGYRDSDSHITYCSAVLQRTRYKEAMALKGEGKYEEAAAIFEELGEFNYSNRRLEECLLEIRRIAYRRAEELLAAGEYEQAEQAYLELGEFKDSVEKAQSVREMITARNRQRLLSGAELFLFPGDRISLPPVIAPAVADGTENMQLRFRSWHPKIASVDENGTVTAVSCGVAQIECWDAEDESVRADVSVHVVKRVSKVSLSPAKLNLSYPDQNGNGTGQLTANLEPADAYIQTGTWRSSDEEVATVDAEGCVTATGVGKATITFVSDDTSKGAREAKRTVTVSQAATSVSLKEESGQLRVGKTIQLKATVLPQDAANRKISWVSADESVATVTSGGKVTARAPGQTVITAVSGDGPSADYALTVKPLPVKLSIKAEAVPAEADRSRKGWSARALLNGLILENGTATRSVDEGDSFTLGYEIWRNDMLPEQGSVTEEITVTAELLSRGQAVEKHLTVYEGDEEHAMEWIVTFTIQRQ